MPEFKEARRIILENVRQLNTERVALLESLGRVLVEDVIAPVNVPAFNNSAMDGYAVRAQDCGEAGTLLPVTDRIFAGDTAPKLLARGTAIKIMTGAALPDGSDAVVPIENAEEFEGIVRILHPAALKQHVRFAGEDVRAGERILAAGTLVRPYEINMLASCGKDQVAVVCRPRIAVVATGDELVELGEPVQAGKIVNSNSYSLAAAIAALGGVPVLVGIARDNAASHREKLTEGLNADALITCAGVSVGDRDLVRESLSELGVESVFWRVKVKPGQVLAFGMRAGKPVFSLPGNPISAMLTFEEFVAPALLKMMGHGETVKPLLRAQLRSGLKKRAGLTYLIRVRLEYSEGRYVAWSAGNQDSARVKTMLQANAIAVLPPDRESFEAGDEIDVHLLDQMVGMNQG